MSENVTIECKGDIEKVDNVNFTTCLVVQSLNIIEENVNITIVITTNNMSRRVNLPEIAWLKAENQTILYLPKGISSKLTNLTRLTIKNCQLKEISSKNLFEFSNLTYLDLSGNEIQFIAPSLFKHNKKLKVLLLNSNRIYYIHHDSFLALTNITLLQVRDNRCYSDEAMNHEQAMILPQNTFCPLNTTELRNEILKIKIQMEYNKAVFFVMILCLVMLLVIIIVMFIFISYKLSSKPSSASQNEARNPADNTSPLVKSVAYGFNEYISSNMTKLPEIIEVADEYDEINYMQYSKRVSMPKVNCEDFYAEPSVYGEQETQENDDDDDDGSFVYSKV